MSYKGNAKFTEVNEQTHQVRMVGDAREVGGSGSTKVSMLSTVAALPSGASEVSVVADVELVGKIVQFGRGMIEEVSRQMFRQFSSCVKQHLEVAEDPQPCSSHSRDSSRSESRRRGATCLPHAVGDHRQVLQNIIWQRKIGRIIRTGPITRNISSQRSVTSTAGTNQE